MERNEYGMDGFGYPGRFQIGMSIFNSHCAGPGVCPSDYDFIDIILIPWGRSSLLSEFYVLITTSKGLSLKQLECIFSLVLKTAGDLST